MFNQDSFLCTKMPSIDSEDFSSSDSEGWEEQNDNPDLKIFSPCLFCEELFTSPEDIFRHCCQIHNFDITCMKQRFKLDCFSYIKMINYIRLKKIEPNFFDDDYPLHNIPWDTEDLLQPVLDDDLLLQYDIEDNDFADCTLNDLSPCLDNQASAFFSDFQHSGLAKKIKTATSKISQLEEALQRATQDITKMKALASNFLMSSVSESNNCQTVAQILSPDEDEAYFSSYAHFSIHEEMLKDKVRTQAFHDAIYKNSALIKNKVVLDVGCGTGILSMFAATAGANHVVGIDQSEIIYQAMGIIRENNLNEKITLLKGRAEDIEIPVTKVDVIISEWIGYFLLFESMLDTVLFARDKWLSKNGKILPDSCNIYLAALSDEKQYQGRITYWNDVYGFKMSCMKAAVTNEATVEAVNEKKIITSAFLLKEFDLYTCSVSDLEFKTPFTLKALNDGSITAFVGYFDVSFDKHCEVKIKLSTSPSDPLTHWKQTVFQLEEPLPVIKDEEITGEFSCSRNRKYPRSLVIRFTIGEQKFRYLME